MAVLELAQLAAARERSSSAVEACALLHSSTGGRFQLRFKRRTVPMLLHRMDREVDAVRHAYFMFKLAYDIDGETTRWGGMTLQVGFTGKQPVPDRHEPDRALIVTIHALPAERWTGSDMIELALAISRAIGVRRARVFGERHDVLKSCPPSKGHRRVRSYDLTMMMLLSRGTTFFGRYGFVPTPTALWAESHRDSDHAVLDLCAHLARLRVVTVASLARHLRAELRLLPSDSAVPHGVRFVSVRDEDGAPHLEVEPVKVSLAELPERQARRRRLLAALEPHERRGTRLLPLLDRGGLPCATVVDFDEYVNDRYPYIRLSRPLKGRVVKWPPHEVIHLVAQISGMTMEAVVQPDPAAQRRAPLCPTGR